MFRSPLTVAVFAIALLVSPVVFAGGGGGGGWSNGTPFAELLELIGGNSDGVDANAADIDDLESAVDALNDALDALSDAQPVTGSVDFGAFAGTQCEAVTFAAAFSSAPRAYASANHTQHTPHGVTHQPITVWFEEVTATGFRVCVREVDGNNRHDEHVVVDWLAL